MRTLSHPCSPVRILLLAVAMGMLGIAGAAADPWKDESGHGRAFFPDSGSFEQEWKPGKYEWRAGDCKYEFKRDGGGFKEEYKCDGAPALASVPLQRFVPSGHVEAGPAAPIFVLGPEVAHLPEGRYCREYQERVTVEGRTQPAYGIACRQPDGSWELMN